jgi:ATP-dependent DNA helicase RecG
MVTTNLIDAYDQLNDFIAKHTLDKFHIIDGQSVSIRSIISRELVSNILVHRDYASAYPAKIIIERDRIVTENWALPKKPGRIDPKDFVPFPRNPILARFFINIGRADVLGSGVRNLYKYTKIYSGGVPELIDGDVFKTIVPLSKSNSIISNDLDGTTNQDNNQVTNQDKRIQSILEFCSIARTREELQQHLGIMNRGYLRAKVLKPLLDSGKLRMTIPDKPNSRHQKYINT